MLFQLLAVPPDHRRVLQRIDELRARLRHVTHAASRWQGLLRRSTFARAIRGSNSIEGYNVTIEDAVAAVEGAPPLEAEKATWSAIQGYRQAMTYVMQRANDPHFSYSSELLRGLHYMMLSYDLTKHPGVWRPGYIAVRNDASGEIVYEGPDSDTVPDLMGELIESLNAPSHLPVLMRAALAHLNLVMIHPFSDGNGRMARVLQSLALAREGILEPEFCSIEEYLGRNTRDYYEVLARVGQGKWHPENSVEPWFRFCLTAHYRQAETLLRRTREMEQVWNEVERIVVRERLPERVALALFDAAYGWRVRNATYRSAAEVNEQTGGRDLKTLADRGLLLPAGEKRGRYYTGSEAILAIRKRISRERSVIDPFTLDQPTLPGLGA